MMVSWELGCRSLQDFWFFRETSFAKQEEALKFNFSVSHCLLSNILWFVALCMRQHATKRKNKDFYFLEQNRVFFMPKAREHGFCFSSLLYAEQTVVWSHLTFKFKDFLWFVTVTQNSPTGASFRVLSKALWFFPKVPADTVTAPWDPNADWFTLSPYISKPWERHFWGGPVSTDGGLYSVSMK